MMDSVEASRIISNSTVTICIIIVAFVVVGFILLDIHLENIPDSMHFQACNELNMELNIDIEACAYYLMDNPDSTGHDIIIHLDDLKDDSFNDLLDEKLLK